MTLRVLAAACGLSLLALPLLAGGYPYGAPPNFDGFQNNCQSCHGSFALNSGTGGVTITSDASAYVPGEPLRLTVTINNTTPEDPGGVGRRNGFVLGVRDASGATVGTYDLGGGGDVQFAQGNPAFVTHTTAGNEQSAWSFDWTAPEAGAPEAVTVYVSANAANGGGNLAGDYIYTAQLPLAIATDAERLPALDEGALALGAVSPLPARARAVVTVTLREAGTVRARLVDGLGRTVRAFAPEARPAGESALALDLGGVAAGVYFLVVETEAGRRTGRVVVAR